MVSSGDTIFAAASGFGRAALSVIRLSGPRVATVLEDLAGDVPPPRRLSLRRLRDGDGEILDEALVVFMPGPASYTGEDQAEFHIHGGLATRAAVLRRLAAMPECRAAEPGEFTRRAFLAGRLDLAQAEGLADLIDAETEAQRRQALRQLGGRLGAEIEGWRSRAIEAMALVEAAIDFSDEGDVPDDLVEAARREIGDLAKVIATALADRRGERLREGFSVVLAGPPNAGKSTLLNALARRDVAIVSDIPGTTRDAIEIRCDFRGLPVLLTDTAGLRGSADPIELAGMERTHGRMQEADLVLWLVPPDIGEAVGTPAPDFAAPILRIGTKADLGKPQPATELNVSAQNGDGLDALERLIEARAESALGRADAVLTRDRHRAALGRAHEALVRALAANRDFPELMAEDIRQALDAFGVVTGRIGVEDILDRLFADFCIGK